MKKFLASAVTLSVLANLALLGWLSWPENPPAGRRDRAPSPLRPAQPAGAEGARPDGPPAAGIADARALTPEQWQRALSGDLSSLVKWLQGAGFPPDAIVGIVETQLEADYAGRIKQLLGLTDDIPPFWSSAGDMGATLASDPKRLQALNELRVEFEDELRKLTGDDYFLARIAPDAPWGPVTDYVSQEKALQLVKLTDEFQRNQQAISSRSVNGVLTPEERQQLADLQKKRRADVAAILTPEEFDQLVFQMNGVGAFPAQVLGQVSGRNLLYPFEPTEQEFLTIYGIRKAFNEQYPNDTPQETQERQRHQNEYQDQVAAALSPDRAAEFRTATVPGASPLARLVTRLDLPKAAVAQTQGIQKDIQDRARAIQTDAALAPAARREQLSALQAEANGRVGSALGDKGLAAYRLSGGAWIQQIVPAGRGAPPPGP